MYSKSKSEEPDESEKGHLPASAMVVLKDRCRQLNVTGNYRANYLKRTLTKVSEEAFFSSLQIST